MRQAALAGDIDALITHSYHFHRAIIEASDNLAAAQCSGRDCTSKRAPPSP